MFYVSVPHSQHFEVTFVENFAQVFPGFLEFGGGQLLVVVGVVPGDEDASVGARFVKVFSGLKRTLFINQRILIFLTE